MSEKTLREVCQIVDVSRRAVQGYEKAGLVTPTGKTERGYLLYDEQSQKRIEKIKLFQDMGFSIKEISEMIDATKEVKKQYLERQVEVLKKEVKSKSAMIQIAKEMIQSL